MTDMFTALFLVCNMATEVCNPIASGQIFKSKEACESYSFIQRDQAIEAINQPEAIVIFKCVNWGEAL
jgi:hypothetical protein